MIGTDNQNDQATQFSIGRWNWDSTYIGGLDEVHVFSFAEGQFNINDVYQIAAAETVPEPSTFVLGGIGLVGLGLVAWRKRRCRC
ncbi:MAG: PEP-CTERM sorting domain-containing protein [Planctomycetes bacterium]|nr:PEP-CTERM sorting domain-containing protein [Planctomycetota bacterium]